MSVELSTNSTAFSLTKTTRAFFKRNEYHGLRTKRSRCFVRHPAWFDECNADNLTIKECWRGKERESYEESSGLHRNSIVATINEYVFEY